jgi:hypothetical protein
MTQKTAIALIAAALTGCLLAADANAQARGGGGVRGGGAGGSRGFVAPNSPSLASPPPQQQQPRNFVGPRSGPSAPMQRGQPVPPLATPPRR